MRDVALFLYDLTGNMAKPWIEAGYTAVIVDMQHKPGIHEDGRLIRVGADIRNGWMPPRHLVERMAFAAAFPPCDHLAVSGARWFKGKGLRKLALSVDLFATAAELCEWLEVPYLIENPVSTMATYWRPADYTFHPHHFTLLEPEDNYTKKTCLWVGGGFVMPKSCQDFTIGAPDDRIHKAPPGPDRANYRSATPMGFARAVFEANRQDRLEIAA
ncbi:hypothetical protein [Cupriavidus alkaliphilus]|uniref:Uncharacterized protein n=1 Tax=Cupriavidus alkaliphilus TaxID=942866 RepID=A0A7W4YTY9_9BURK|nr:hypothetical protein [Cupriavidus alkaliphilus]MBB3010694.1 hypothetical protein [Cupriavidus alkaliphilus]